MNFQLPHYHADDEDDDRECGSFKLDDDDDVNLSFSQELRNTYIPYYIALPKMLVHVH